MLDIVAEALLDTAKTVPFLFGAYLLLEFIAHSAGDKVKSRLTRYGRFGAIWGALLGLIPQCGFSVAAVGFYVDRVITPGALLAVFLATSDEALPILLSPRGVDTVMPLIVAKLIIAMGVGLFVDFALAPLWKKIWEEDSELRHHHEHGEHEHHEADEHCHHNHCNGGVLKVALARTIRVASLIFVISVLLGVAFEYFGAGHNDPALDGYGGTGTSAPAPLLAALFGLVPNCAVSVFLANLYLKGALSFGSVVAGLSSGAGVAPLVLFQSCRKKREAFAILAFLFLVGALAGFVIDAFFAF